MNSENIKNKLFFLGMFLLISTSVGVTYYRYVVALDYFVLLQSSCDPVTESCFLYQCDPTVPDAECSEDPKDDEYYYKNVEKKAYAIQSCVNGLDGCAEAQCIEGEKNCTETLCDVSLEESGGVCYGPGLVPEEESEDGEESEETIAEEEEDTSLQESGVESEEANDATEINVEESAVFPIGDVITPADSPTPVAPANSAPGATTAIAE